MKRYYFLILLGLVLLAGCGPSPKQASEYNNKLIKEQKNAVDKLDNLIASLNTFDPQQMNAAYKEAVDQLDKSIANLEKIEAFDGSTAYRDTTIYLLKIYKDVVVNDFSKVIEKLSKPDDQYTPQDQAAVSSQLVEIQEKLTTANKNYKKYQEEFAKKYKLQLSQTE